MSSEVASATAPSNTVALWDEAQGWAQLTSSEKNDLIGNSMNAFVVGSLLAFVIAKMDVIVEDEKQNKRHKSLAAEEPQRHDGVEGHWPAELPEG